MWILKKLIEGNIKIGISQIPLNTQEKKSYPEYTKRLFDQTLSDFKSGYFFTTKAKKPTIYE
jgi:hypothetical protein